MKASVLVTNDGSEASLRVLPHAARFATACNGRIVLLRVLDRESDLGDIPALDRESGVRDLMARWETGLVSLLESRGIEGEAEVRLLGSDERLAEAVVAAASERDAMLIAMHSRGAGAVRHALLGSVALGVLASTSLPLMLSGPDTLPPRSGQLPYQLVITSDGSAASNIVVIALGSALSVIDADVTLLHVCELRSGRPNPAGEVAASARQLETIRNLLPERLHARVQVPAVPCSGHVAQDILLSACRMGADAIALSTHGHSALRHLLAGSTALDLLAKSPFPLILTRYAG
jgi:nucleotide-binding universal stress UspA family protein